jgi:hypothetical protein
MTRFDTAGKPFHFSFEIPEGFVVKESHAHQISTADVTRDLDGDGWDEFILRITQNGNVMKNARRSIDNMSKHPSTEETLDYDVAGRRMYVQRTRTGEMVGFIGYFPALEDPDSAYMIMGGVTDAPKPCRERAAEITQKMLMSFERNARVEAAPEP